MFKMLLVLFKQRFFMMSGQTHEYWIYILLFWLESPVTKVPDASKIRVSFWYSKSLDALSLGIRTLAAGLNLIV
jgi:hypothetical protein